MHGHAGGGLCIRGTTEVIQAQIVSQDPRQQLCLGSFAVIVLGRIVGGRFNARPRGSPQWIHPRSLVRDGGDVPSFDSNNNLEQVVLECDGATVTVVHGSGSP
jgi:hypothetical protein